MPTISVRITNLEAIRAAFSRSPVLMTRELNKAIKTSLFAIERDSKLRTPVDTGRLRASHQTTFSPLRGVLEPTAEYAIYVHEGTRYMRARPFLLQSVQKNESVVQRNFESAVQNVLDEIGDRT